MRNDVDKVLLSIVIINYRTPILLTDCLKTLLPEIINIDARVVIVDNYSNDESPLLIKKWLSDNDTESKVLFVQSNMNAGFAAGNNIGIKSLDASYYLLLNSDTLIRKGAIKTLLDTAALNPKAGLISPRLEWPNGKGQESCFRFHHPLSEFMNAAHTGFIDRLLKHFIVALPVQTQIINPEWTSFACVLIRHEVFQQLGLLDEGYFMYFEDAQFCNRAYKSGWQIVHNPDAAVVHLRGGSSPVKSNTILKKRLPKYYYESRARYFYQLYGWFGLTMANLLWSMGRTISKVRQLLGRTDKAISEKQWLDIWTNWHQPLKKYTHPGSNKIK